MADPADVKPQTDRELIEWGLDIEEGLTEWEMTFLESARNRLNQGFSITSLMRTKLEQIIIEKG